MKTIIPIIALCAILTLLISCTPQASEQVATTQPQQEKQVPSQEEQPQEQETQQKSESNQFDSKTQGVLDKGEDVTNYKYRFSTRVRRSNGNYDEEIYTASIKNGKIKKEFLEPQKYEGGIFFYDGIYLDLTKKTAFAVCENPGILCESFHKQAYPLSYPAQELEKTPLSLLLAISSSTKKVGEEQVDKRETVIFEYTNSQDHRERLSVGKFYGLPLKQVIYDTVDDKEIILEETTFSIISVGNIKNSHVVLPGEFEIIE